MGMLRQESKGSMNPRGILAPMNPKLRPGLFVESVFVLMAPYLGFVMYYSQRFPSNQWPSWFTETIAVWFIANFVLPYAAGQKNIQETGSGTAERTPCLCDSTNRCLVSFDCVECVVSIRGERSDKGQPAPQPCDSSGCVLVVFHRNFRVGSLPRKARKSLNNVAVEIRP